MLLFSTSTIIVDRYHIRKPLSAGSWHDLFCCRLLCVTRFITMLKISYIGVFLSTTLFIKFVFSVSGYVQDLLLYVESQLHRINPDSDGHCDWALYRNKVPSESARMFHVKATYPYTGQHMADSGCVQYTLHSHIWHNIHYKYRRTNCRILFLYK